MLAIWLAVEAPNGIWVECLLHHPAFIAQYPAGLFLDLSDASRMPLFLCVPLIGLREDGRGGKK